MAVNLRLVTVLCAVLAMGCSTGTPSSSPSAAGSSRPAHRNFVVGGDRPVTVHVPASYDAGSPAPLVIVLHGYTSTGRDQDAYFHLDGAVERRGIITAYPDGTVDRAGNQFWSATDACCDFDESGVDDSKYLVDVVTAIKAHVAVDPKRVYFMGWSNGGFMSYRMACDHADVIAAIVSLSAATFAHAADCQPTAPVSVLEIHGSADQQIDFDGGSVTGPGTATPMPAYPGAKQTVQTWATYDGCDPAGSESPKRVDVDADHGTATEPAEASVKAWGGCRNGAAVELWTMPGSGHAPNISKAFPDAALDFLLAHPKP
jgi:polyhydroxybutyrate depolymerase